MKWLSWKLIMQTNFGFQSLFLKVSTIFSSCFTTWLLRWQNDFLIFLSHFYLKFAKIVTNSPVIIKKICGRCLVNALEFCRRAIQIWGPESESIAPGLHSCPTQLSEMTAIYIYFLSFLKVVNQKNTKRKNLGNHFLPSYKQFDHFWFVGLEETRNQRTNKDINMRRCENSLALSNIRIIT